MYYASIHKITKKFMQWLDNYCYYTGKNLTERFLSLYTKPTQGDKNVY